MIVLVVFDGGDGAVAGKREGARNGARVVLHARIAKLLHRRRRSDAAAAAVTEYGEWTSDETMMMAVVTTVDPRYH